MTNLNIREHLIISQALYTAIPVLEAEENPHTSNIEDMKELLENKFPLWSVVEAASELAPTINGCKEECGTTE